MILTTVQFAFLFWSFLCLVFTMRLAFKKSNIPLSWFVYHAMSVIFLAIFPKIFLAMEFFHILFHWIFYLTISKIDEKNFPTELMDSKEEILRIKNYSAESGWVLHPIFIIRFLIAIMVFYFSI